MAQTNQTSLTSNANWMRDTGVLNLSIQEICLPGSHNSFSHNCNTKMSPAKEFASFPKFLNNFLKSWSETQTLTISEQLEQGIRYLDIRIEKRDNEIYTVHGLFCDKLLDVCLKIIQFIKTHPQEVIVIDINHSYEMQCEDYISLQRNIVEIFGDVLIERNKEYLTIPLGELVAMKKNVFFFYDKDRFNFDIHEKLWTQNDIYSYWPNKTNFDEVSQRIVADGLHKIDNHRKNKVTILQIILTPDEKTIAGGYLSFMTKPSSLQQLNEMAREKFLKFIYEEPIQSFAINILLFDFVRVKDPFILFCIERSKLLSQSKRSFVKYVPVEVVHFDNSLNHFEYQQLKQCH